MNSSSPLAGAPLSVVILAAGQGTRMRSAQPKVLQKLAGRPLLSHVIDCARALEADDVCVVYGFGGDAVRAAFDGDDIRWALQAEQLGTGHAVMQAMPGTPERNRVLILFGDVPLLKPATLERVVSGCGRGEAAVLTVEMDDPFGYGRIVRENGRVVRNVEQKDASAEEQAIREINTGVLCLDAASLKAWLGRLRNDNRQGEYYLTD
ncbi:MAG: NTP transferase domain-containing protein, partial [Woeseiaceae bacterium]